MASNRRSGEGRKPARGQARARAKAGAPRPRGLILRNARHERFAQELAQGKSATEAYRRAGFKANRQAASRLVTNVDILARVAELKNIAAERATITTQRLIEEAAHIQDLALDDCAYSSAVSALVSKAKFAGLLPAPPPAPQEPDWSKFNDEQLDCIERALSMIQGIPDPGPQRGPEAQTPVVEKITALIEVAQLKEKVANLEAQLDALLKLNALLEQRLAAEVPA